MGIRKLYIVSCERETCGESLSGVSQVPAGWTRFIAEQAEILGSNEKPTGETKVTFLCPSCSELARTVLRGAGINLTLSRKRLLDPAWAKKKD